MTLIFATSGERTGGWRKPECRQHTTKNIIQLIQLFLIVSIQFCCLNTLHRYRKNSDNRILNLITKKHHVTVSNKFNLYVTKDHLLHPTTFERWNQQLKVINSSPLECEAGQWWLVLQYWDFQHWIPQFFQRLSFKFVQLI